MVKGLRRIPGASLFLCFRLQVPSGQVQSHRIAENMVQGITLRNVSSAFVKRRHQFDFMMKILGGTGIVQKTSGRHHSICRFAEEKGFLSFRIRAHLECVFRIISADTINPMHREILRGSCNFNKCLGFGVENEIHEKSSGKKGY